jgi:hypothetical protein
MISIRTTSVLAAAFALGLSLLSPAQASTAKHQPVPPASFLSYRVDSVAQLLAQVRSNRAVRLRYAHLYNISENKVVDYMSKNLVESYVPATGKYTVYCVSRNGRLFAVKQQFHSGIRVFALRNGTPVMKWACGNPLTKSLPAPPQAPTMQSKTIRHPVVQQPVVVATLPMIEETPSEQAATTPEEAPLPQSTAHQVVLAPVEQVQGSTEQLVFSSSATRIPVLAFVPLIGLIPRGGSGTSVGSISRNGGGSGSNTGTRGGNGSPPASPPVPETNPALAVMLGLVPLGGLVFASRRRNSVVPVQTRDSEE